MALQGRLYGIKVGGENGDFIDCEISCEITVTRDILNKSGSHGGQYKHFRYGYTSWSITFDAKTVISPLLGAVGKLLENQLNGDIIEVYITNRISNTEVITIGGNVLLPNLSITFPNTGASTFNITCQGTGELMRYFEEYGTIINAQPYFADKPYIVDTTKW